jgi:probable HAF family extracellular repeat protein
MRTIYEAVVVTFVIGFCSVAHGQVPTFQGLGFLPGGTPSSGVDAISADGTVVVGGATSASGNEAFRWNSATGMVGLGDLPGGGSNPNGRGSEAQGVSADGSVVVGKGSSADSVPVEAFSWTQQNGMVGLGYLSSEKYSEAFGTSGDGSVVVGTGESYDAFRWTEQGGMQPLATAIVGVTGSGARAVSGDGSVVVGDVSTAAGDQAMRWTQATGMVGLGYLPNPTENQSLALGVSQNGQVIVGFSSSVNTQSGDYEAFRWTQAGGMVGLGDLPGGSFNSSATSVSADGSVIVGNSTTATGQQAFIWDAQDGMRVLQGVLAGYGLGGPLSGWQLTTAVVSADGVSFAGTGIDPQGHTEAWVATVPEPASLVLATMAAAVLLFCRRGKPV